jgi:hypothetical protein
LLLLSVTQRTRQPRPRNFKAVGFPHERDCVFFFFLARLACGIRRPQEKKNLKGNGREKHETVDCLLASCCSVAVFAPWALSHHRVKCLLFLSHDILLLAFYRCRSGDSLIMENLDIIWSRTWILPNLRAVPIAGPSHGQ